MSAFRSIVSRLSLSVILLTTCSALARAEDSSGNTADTVKNKVEHGAEKTKKALTTAAEKTDHALHTAADKTAQALKKTGDKIEEKLGSDSK